MRTAFLRSLRDTFEKVTKIDSATCENCGVQSNAAVKSTAPLQGMQAVDVLRVVDIELFAPGRT